MLKTVLQQKIQQIWYRRFIHRMSTLGSTRRSAGCSPSQGLQKSAAGPLADQARGKSVGEKRISWRFLERPCHCRVNSKNERRLQKCQNNCTCCIYFFRTALCVCVRRQLGQPKNVNSLSGEKAKDHAHTLQFRYFH